ncbi:hypothetical protein, partial [Nocardia sp. NPDC059239]|uniref:hypothetical protein n=1 Tax=unclassified Nocardia TaxID=2637762 RepID=UPI0036B72D68
MINLDTIPAHVPRELVVDFNLYDLEGGNDDPQTSWKRNLGAALKEPLLYTPHSGGHWIATRPEDIAAIQRDATAWSSQDVTAPKHVGDRFLPLESDDPEHAAYRKAFLAMVSNKALREIEPPARALAVDLIEGFQEKGHCDFISDLALKFPLAVFLNIMGLPVEDGIMINDWLHTYVSTSVVEEKIRIAGQIATYVRAQVDDRIENPRDDGLTQITKGQMGDRPLTREEIYNIAQMLTMGGIDSVAMHLSFIVIHLAQNPDKREYVRNNLDSLERIITEYGRRYFINNMFRTVTEDREFHGVQLKAGDLIALTGPRWRSTGYASCSRCSNSVGDHCCRNACGV